MSTLPITAPSPSPPHPHHRPTAWCVMGLTDMQLAINEPTETAVMDDPADWMAAPPAT